MNKREKTWRCSCGGSHYMTLTTFDTDTNDPELLMEVETYLELDGQDYWSWQNTLWGRIKAAVDILLHGQHLWFDVVVDRQMAKEIITELKKVR